MRQILAVVLVLAALAGLVLVLVGCESPEAQRERAEAERLRAEAAAYQVKTQADTQAAAERSAIRQSERDAAHQRTLETLPFVLAIGGGVLLVGLGLLFWWDLRTRQPAPISTAAADPGLLVYLDRQERRLAELERATWHAIAAAQRTALDAGDNGREVVIYTDRQ